MKRVVITGMGAVSCIGNDMPTITESLQSMTCGISYNEEYEKMGMRSLVSGTPDIDFSEHIDRKQLRFMGDAAAYAYISAKRAIENAGLDLDAVGNNPRVGLIMGSGGASSLNLIEAADILREKGLKRVGPYRVTRTMSSTVSACLATPLKIQGVNYSITSACATSAHCVGNAMELIQLGKQDMIIAGGGEEEHWTQSALFDAMGAMSTKYNDSPKEASRTYDKDRDGFVIAGGGGAVILEEYEHAKKRGANIIAEIVGYGATSDGADMVAPSGEGAVRCMKMALEQAGTSVDYINTHGTSTPVGDLAELGALKETFGSNMPQLSSSKPLTGHSLGAVGVQEAIYSLLMLQNGFIGGSANIENLDDAAAGFPIVTSSTDASLNAVMTNSFGFGGTNACLVFKKV